MAKVRRIVRRVARPRDFFDEHQWPVNVALLVLASFLVGSAIAYQRFDDPRWAYNAWTTVLGAPLLVVGVLAALHYVGHRWMRRTMQLGLVVSLLLHLLFVLGALQVQLFNQVAEAQAANETVRREVVVPEYHRVNQPDRQRLVFEEPVETPEPELREEQPEPRPQPDPEPAVAERPVETPIPQDEPDPTPQMNVQRREADSAVARQSPSLSRLSRSRSQQTAEATAESREAKMADAKPAANPTALAATELAPRRAENIPRAERQSRQAPGEPQSATRAARLQRSEAQQAADLAAAALPRRLAKPTTTPRAETTSEPVPSAAQRTSPEALQPANTLAVKQQTTSPQETQRAAPEAPAPLERQSVARNAPAPELPQVAQADNPTPNRQPRMTQRPSAEQSLAGADTSAKTTARETLQPQAADARSSVADAGSRSLADIAPPTPPSATPSETPAQRAERATPTPSPALASSAPRQVRSPQPRATTNPESANAPDAQQPSGGLAPSRLADAARRSAPAEAAAAPELGMNAPPASSAAPSRATAMQRAQGREAADSTADSASVNRRTNQSAIVALEAPEFNQPNKSPAAREAQGGLRPDAGELVRQSPARNGNRANAAAAENAVAAAESSSPMASARATTPSPLPSQESSASAARAALAADVGGAPAADAAPQLLAAGQSGSSARADLAPAALSLSRGRQGQAGSGATNNLADAAPAGVEAAPTPSSAARREAAQQNADDGPALAPSAPAQRARSLASAITPSTQQNINQPDVATTAGSRNTSPSLSASAATLLQKSNAESASASAAAGALTIDTGATQLVRDTGAARAAGGDGRPQMQADAPGADLGRSQLAGMPDLQADPANARQSQPAGGQPQPALAAREAEATRPSSAEGGATGPGAASLLAGGPSDARQDPGGPLAARAAGDAADGTPARESGNEDEEAEERLRRERALRLARRALGGAPGASLAPAETNLAVAGGGPAGGNEPALAAASSSLSRAANGAAAAEAAPAPAPAGQATPGSGQPQLARAEAADGVVGESTPGGGSQSLERRAARPLFAANNADPLLQAAGRPSSSGETKGQPLAAQGARMQRGETGAAESIQAGPVGALSAETAVELAQAGARRVQGDSRSDAVARGAPGGGLARSQSELAAAALARVASPSELPLLEEGDGGSGLAASELPMQRPSPSGGGGFLAELDAPQGPGGLAADLPDAIGTPSRQSSKEQTDAVITPSRFLRQNVGGRPSAESSVVLATEPFRQRAARGQGDSPGGGRGRPGPQTERAIELGLSFLARHQLANGGWSLEGFDPEQIQIQSDGAATALALLAFQGAGYHHKDFQYAANVQAGLDYLILNQNDEGMVFVDSGPTSNPFVKLYTHALAAIALCEAYGMTQDPELREPAQRALDFIVQSQDTQLGGWRYQPGQDSDTSVTGWMTMALKSGELAELKVPPEAFARINRWLDSARVSADQPHLFRYNPNAPDNPREILGRSPSKSITAVGLLMRMYLGWKRDNPNLRRGADYLAEHLPKMGVLREAPYEKNRDTYYWYYATQVMFHMGGDYWRQWNEALHRLLLETQTQDGTLAGSWDPRRPIPDRWGPRVGRLYVTAMNLLSLEVYYRHLPLYDETGR